jgi:hypothetical protein
MNEYIVLVIVQVLNKSNFYSEMFLASLVIPSRFKDAQILKYNKTGGEL